MPSSRDCSTELDRSLLLLPAGMNSRFRFAPSFETFRRSRGYPKSRRSSLMQSGLASQIARPTEAWRSAVPRLRQPSGQVIPVSLPNTFFERLGFRAEPDGTGLL